MTGARSLVPEAIEARASARGRLGIAFGPRFFVLLLMSLLWAAPLLFDARFAYGLAAWDVLIVVAWVIDLWRLPAPHVITASRRWNAPASLSVASEVRVEVANASPHDLVVRVVDDVPSGLRRSPPLLTLAIARQNRAEAAYEIQPIARGVQTVGAAYIRYATTWGVAERWVRVPLQQSVVVYPNLVDARHESLAAIRSRQWDGRRNPRQNPGAGRVFESLREYQSGDDLRDVCWTATARRTRLTTKNYEVEPSQHLWIVLDTGRLMRTRVTADATAAGSAVVDCSKLDLAVNAALTLSTVALRSGDRVGLLAYGRRITAQVANVRGVGRLSQLVEPLARVDTEVLEADHFAAAAQLSSAQKRRALVVWITDLPDMAVTPHVVRAARSLMRRHLVVFAVIGQPDLGRVASRAPTTPDEMYQATAAQEIMHRRDLLIARLRSEGALAFEVSAGLSSRIVNTYLHVKERGLL
jgi:uncharacterized protein (DUF58 family)